MCDKGEVCLTRIAGPWSMHMESCFTFSTLLISRWKLVASVGTYIHLFDFEKSDTFLALAPPTLWILTTRKMAKLRIWPNFEICTPPRSSLRLPCEIWTLDFWGGGYRTRTHVRTFRNSEALEVYNFDDERHSFHWNCAMHVENIRKMRNPQQTGSFHEPD